VLLQREQFRRSDDRAFCLRVAKAIITGKLRNSALVLSRYARKRSAPALAEAAQTIADSVRQLDAAASIEQARGYEGIGAKAYYAAWVRTLDAEWGFTGRNRQPPRDPVNALLSYGYTLLFYNIYALIRARGLNPHVGFLHPLRAGHAALVSDLMEEFRSLTVDAPVFNLIINDRVTPGEFTTTEDGACRMSDEARRQFIHAFEAKLSSAITYPVTNQPLDYRRCIDRQVQQMAALIRGRSEHYVPMVPR
jgi:CRISPR-associated protein Cas1